MLICWDFPSRHIMFFWILHKETIMRTILVFLFLITSLVARAAETKPDNTNEKPPLHSVIQVWSFIEREGLPDDDHHFPREYSIVWSGFKVKGVDNPLKIYSEIDTCCWFEQAKPGFYFVDQDATDPNLIFLKPIEFVKEK